MTIYLVGLPNYHKPPPIQILFDRGFYSKELMLTLANLDYPYLIFVPKNDKIKKELEAMEVAERKSASYHVVRPLEQHAGFNGGMSTS